MKTLWLPVVLAACADPAPPAPPPEPTVPPVVDTGAPVETAETGLVPGGSAFDCYANRALRDLVRNQTVLTAFIGFDDTFDEPLKVYEATDTDLDGEPDTVVRWGHDDRGFLVSITSEREGLPTSTTTLDNDERGNPLVGRVDLDGDGEPDAVSTMTWDDHDLLLTRETDSDADGTVDRTEVYTRAADGRMLSYGLTLGDRLVRSITASYDDEDRLTLLVVDDQVNDDFDARETYAYKDPTGPDHTVTVDEGDDGQVDRVEGVTHDADGRVVGIAADTDVDGIADTVTTNTYDAEGRILTRRVAPPEPERLQVTTWTWDHRGRLVNTEVLQPPDGTLLVGTSDAVAYGGTCP